MWKEVYADNLSDILVGRKIVAIDRAHDTLTLDNGTQIEFRAGGDCCAWFDLDEITGEPTDNVITHVKESPEPTAGGRDAMDIVIFAEHAELNRLIIDGDAGSGYYGHSIEMQVITPRTPHPDDIEL